MPTSGELGHITSKGHIFTKTVESIHDANKSISSLLEKTKKNFDKFHWFGTHTVYCINTESLDCYVYCEPSTVSIPIKESCFLNAPYSFYDTIIQHNLVNIIKLLQTFSVQLNNKLIKRCVEYVKGNQYYYGYAPQSFHNAPRVLKYI